MHKTANVLNKLPKSQHAEGQARACRKSGWRKPEADAETAFDAFIETYALKYEKAAECLKKDREALLAFYDFPAEHWKHLRTTNPIESTFATVRHRTIRSKGCLSNKTALAMVFKLVDGAQKSWRRLDGHNQLPKIIQGVKFTDGLEVAAKPTALKPKPPPPDPSGRHQKLANRMALLVEAKAWPHTAELASVSKAEQDCCVWNFPGDLAGLAVVNYRWFLRPHSRDKGPSSGDDAAFRPWGGRN